MRAWADRILGVEYPDPGSTRRAQTLLAFLMASVVVSLIAALAVLPYEGGGISAFFLVLTAVICALLVLAVHRGHLNLAVMAFALVLMMVTVGQPLSTQDMSTNPIVIPLATLMLLYLVPLRRWYLVLGWVVAALVILQVGTTDEATMQLPREAWLLNIVLATIMTVIVVMYSAYQLTQSVRREEALSHQLSAREAVLHRLEELANSDPLTGFLNRRSMQQCLEQVGPSCAYALIDLDNFKAVNDEHSHAAGDAVLAHFSTVVADLAQPDDLLFRLGGDEFLVARPNEDATDLGKWLHDLRAAALSGRPSGVPDTTRITFSAGVVNRSGASAADTLARADKALYAAKEQGRDAIVVVD